MNAEVSSFPRSLHLLFLLPQINKLTGILASAVTKKQNTLTCLVPAQICDTGFSTGAYIKTLTEPEKTNDER